MENSNDLFKPGNTKLILAGILSAEILVLIIGFTLFFYAQPLADDFTRACNSKGIGIYEFVKFRYNTWSGRWASMAGTSSLSRFDIFNYYYIPLITLAGLFAFSIHFFVCSILKTKFFKILSIFISLSILVLYWSSMASPGQTFYWFSGAIDYHGVAAFGLLLFGLIIRASDAKATLKSYYLFALLPVIFILPGFHEYWALMCCGILLILSISAFYKKHPSRWLILFALIFLIAASLFVIKAPGHKVRGNLYENGYNIKFALTITIHKMIEFLSNWILNIKLWSGTVLFLFWPGIKNDRFKNHDNKILWWISLLLLFTLTLSIAGPAYIMGRTPPDRFLNISYLLFIVGWFVLILGLRNRWQIKPTEETRALLRPVVFLSALIWSSSIITLENTPNAVFDLTGTLPEYKKAFQIRNDQLRQAASQGPSDIEVDYITPPQLFFDSDITLDQSHWTNNAVAKYFGLESVKLKKSYKTK